jgi:tRNA(Ile)-lysidine synthetase-like protein
MSHPMPSERTMRAVQQRLLRAFRADFATPPNRLVVGFSGGSDSLALSIVLKRIAGAIPSSVELVHVNHHLRPDSIEDAIGARALAESLELPFTLRDIQGNVRHLHPGVGIEEAARRERYLQFLAESDDEGVIVLGHHAQDQAETILLHLIRGAGLLGASGMTRLSSINVPWWGGMESPARLRIWRPLLNEDRDQLRTIPGLFNLLPVEDPSNVDEAFQRNALRNRVVPELKEIEPGAIEAIGRFGQIASAEDRLLAKLASEQAMTIADGSGGLRVDALLAINIALQRRVVQQWLKKYTDELPPFERVSAVLALAESGSESAHVEVFKDNLAGIFGNSLRCGDKSTLREQAHQDAGLSLPLWEDERTPSIDSIIVVVCNDDSLGNTITIPQPDRPYSRMNLRLILDDELIEGAGVSAKAWMRRARVSPWIRDLVTGIALDDRLWWIPRISDDYAGNEPLYVRWNAEESN